MEWSGKAELGHSPVSLQLGLAVKSASRPEVVLVQCEKHVHIQYLPRNERDRIDDGEGICEAPSGTGLDLGDMERGEAAQVCGSFDTCVGGSAVIPAIL